ncbi:replication-relaxation family protein [Kitasatospora cineracea]
MRFEIPKHGSRTSWGTTWPETSTNKVVNLFAPRPRLRVLTALVDADVLVGNDTPWSQDYLLSGLLTHPYSWYEPTVNHFLATAEVYVLLAEADRAGALTVLDFQSEPQCWRTFDQRTLKPDAFAKIGLVLPDGRRVKGSFFIEVDRANQYGAKIAGKIPQYLAYYQHHQLAGTATVLPRQVVFLAPDTGRVRYLERLIAKQSEGRRLFGVGLLDDPVTALTKS